MTTYVLVPGFWLGAWAWRSVADELRGHGHDVHPLSLTGLGERAHLARPDTDLDTHVTDVVNLVHYADLHDVVLVGHSYAGSVVIPSVADRIPERISKLVFIDAGPLPDGMASADFLPADQRAQHVEQVRTAGHGWQLPPPPWAQPAAGIDLTDAALDELTRLSAPQPWATATTPVHLTGAWEKVPRLHVLCSFPIAQVRARAAEPAFAHMSGDDWDYRELPSWHWPMVNRATELAAILHEA